MTTMVKFHPRVLHPHHIIQSLSHRLVRHHHLHHMALAAHKVHGDQASLAASALDGSVIIGGIDQRDTLDTEIHILTSLHITTDFLMDIEIPPQSGNYLNSFIC